MIFCGQCGLQLASGDTRCPHCGATVESDGTLQGSPHRDDPTIASLSSIPLQPNTPPYSSVQSSPQTSAETGVAFGQ